ncbi:hypothetical protein CLV62_12814 [Dysgonomonas alginatilytica]|uniref:Calycin-like beta-barrel protein n=1 Tax=Dysgonomonas alginatilytica TaxID=1605892 RepID=A0A2V3PKI3_9BACT|nr:hypothetical protein [Dysgonomonas alginatilytica]PXV60927.1 hypothetical protein CLV62_12814 [Dysgonomonas alginatilytica]
MKAISKIFGLMLTIAVAFSSCGGDDDNGDGKSEYTLKDAICKYSHDLGIASAGAQTITLQTTTNLDDMLKGYDYVAPITGGTMNLTKVTSIEIVGLKEGVVLQKFSLTINGVTKEFGDITTAKIELYNDVNLEYFKNVFNTMVSQKKLIVSATFTPSSKITDADALKVNFAFNGNFTYRK